MAHQYVLGISAFYHASAAALLRGGDIVAAAQGERFTRGMGDADFAKHAVTYCPNAPGISIATMLAVGGILVPAKLGPIGRTWIGIARTIAKITTPIFMAVLYFVVVTPIAFLRRTLGGNGLRHRSGQLGYWRDRTQSERGRWSASSSFDILRRSYRWRPTA